jgi:PAS domain S-box-containing protein
LFKRLNKIDLSGRLDGAQPRLLTQAVVAAALLAMIAIGRRMIEAGIPGVAPFSLLYPAVLVATLMTGWVSGVLVMVLGGLLAWLFIMHHLGAGPIAVGDVVSLALYFVSAGAIVAFAEAYRTTARMLLAGQTALSESEARLELATHAASIGVWEWRPLENEMIYSEEAKAICGFPPGEPVTYEMAATAAHPEDRPHTAAQAARAMDPEIRDTTPYEYRLVRPDGEVRWVMANASAVFEERDGKMVTRRYVGTLQDITERKRAEEARVEAAARLRLAVDAGHMAIWQVDSKRGVVNSSELNRIMGFPDDARPSFKEVTALYLPGEYDRVQAIAEATVARGEQYFEVEHRIRRPDGEIRWLLIRAELAVDAQGQIGSAIGVVMDITERKDSEERLKLLAREVDHRANNLLAVVQGTVQLSQAPTVQALKAVLIGRVAALGRAHQLLSEARWEGADLRRLVEEELLAFSLGEAARVSIEGPAVALAPAAAQGLAMALHELATNAAKYGALSTPEGVVSVAWTRPPGGPLILRWVERGGPPTKAPSRRGLGTTMLARALAGPLGGSSRMDWRPEGLVCELELPSEALEPAPVM